MDIPIRIRNCPFCKKDKVEFRWDVFPTLGGVICTNWEDHCCARGPQQERRKYDNELRTINRAIKAWNNSWLD